MKIIGITMILAMMLAVQIAFAEETTAAASAVSATRTVIKTLGFLGKGIAVLPSDPMSFKMVKAGLATVKVTLAGEETEVTIGVLFLDDEKYKLKNVIIGNGTASGDVYLNDTKVGSVAVSSVRKGDVEVWAGTLSINSVNYYLYILEAPRPIKAVELRDKVSEYCTAHHEDENCREKIAQYCENNPSDNRCVAIFRNYCLSHLDDSRCRDAIKNYCDENPEISDCRVFIANTAEKFCDKYPNSTQCQKINEELTEFCLTEPTNDKCKVFCKQHPAKCSQLVKSLADYCIDNANDTKCVDYCKKYPAACKKLAINLAELCIKNPNDTSCIDYCKMHPAACKVVTAALANFCIGNENNTKCVSYCSEHPGACRRVVTEVSSYCEKNPASIVCTELTTNVTCSGIVCVWDPCPGKHLPDAKGCVNCASPCPSNATTTGVE